MRDNTKDKRLDPNEDQGISWFVESCIICIAAAFTILGTYAQPIGEPALSRLATVYSLAKHGTFTIELPAGQPANPFAGTVDRVMVKGEPVGPGVAGGNIVSSKPPVMPLIMTAEYLILHRLLGWDLVNEEDVHAIARFMTITLVGAAYIAALVFLRKTLLLMQIGALARIVSLCAVAFGSQLWGFSVILNNHVPGACMTVLSLYLAVRIAAGPPGKHAFRFFLFGVASGLVVALDMPGAVFPFLAAVFLVLRFPRQTLTWAVLGAAIPLCIHSGVLYAVTGSPMPVQVDKAAYLFETSYWRHPFGIDGLNEPRGTYLFHMTFGRCGLFSLYPVLFCGVAAVIWAALRPDARYRPALLAGGAGFVIMTVYYVFKTNNYGGESYGFRWYIAAMPVLALMAAPFLDSLRRRWQWLLVAALLAVSFYSAWECTRVGWQSSQEWTCRMFGPCT